MNEAEELTEQAAEPADETTWETPGHAEVDTSPDVTGDYGDSL
ncbi:pyrroloquinoline quinone precursor peptide PqqA [Streptomyces sp. 5K101]